MKNDPQDDTPQDDTNSPEGLPVINIDDDPDNANWLRILEQRRKEQEQRKKDESPNGRQPQ